MAEKGRHPGGGVSIEGGGASGVRIDGTVGAHGTGVATEQGIPKRSPGPAPGAPTSAADRIKADVEWFKDLFAALEKGEYFDTGKTLGIELAQRIAIIEGRDEPSAEVAIVEVVKRIEKYASGKDSPIRQAIAPRAGVVERKKFDEIWLPTLKRIAVAFGEGRKSEGWASLRVELRKELKKEGLARLRAQAENYYSDDGKIDAHEYASLCRDFVRYGIVEDEVKAACREFEGAHWVPPAAAPEAAYGFEAYVDWDTGKDHWTLDDLLDAVERNFATGERPAIDGLLASERDRNYFSGWLAQGKDPGKQRAFAARQEAVKYFQGIEGVGRELAAWVFLWELGRPALHLASPGVHITPDMALRARTPRELAESVATRDGALQAAAGLLRSGVLEAWLERVAKGPDGKPIAKTTIEEARRGRRRVAKAADSDTAACAAVQRILWMAAKGFRDLVLDVDGTPCRVKSVEELTAMSAVSPSYFEAYQVAFHSGALEAWLDRFDKERAESIDEAKKHGDLADVAWRWMVGRDDYLLRARANDANWISVRGIDELIAKTDSGEALLDDDDLESGRLGTYCRLALRRQDFAALAGQYATDGLGRPAERWRQRAGARTFVVAGHDASTREAFARLGLELGNRAAKLKAEDIVGVLAAGIVEARFGAERPQLSQGLEDLRVRTDIDVEQRALLACVMCGLRELPLPEAGGVVHAPDELFEAVRSEPLRARVVHFLESGVLGQWIVNVVAADRIDATHVFAAQEMSRAAPTPARKTAILLGLLRGVTRDRSLRLPDGRVVVSRAQLDALILDPAERALLDDAAVRERIRDAFGVFGGPLLTDATAREDVSEERLAALAPDQASERREESCGLVFAWQFLGIPVLWLGRGHWRVTSLPELLVVMADGDGRVAVAEAASTGVLPAWLRLGLGHEVPRAFATAVDAASFPQFALWLGDEPPRIRLEVASALLVIPENGHVTTRVTVHNEDPVRAAHVILTVVESGGARADGLVLQLGESGTEAAAIIAPAKLGYVPVRVSAPAGRAGETSLSLEVALPTHDGTRVSAGNVVLPVRIIFPGAILAKASIVGASLGGLIALALRGARSGICSSDALHALRGARTGAFPADVLDRAWSLVVVSLLLAMIGYRMLVSILNKESLPEARKVKFALNTGGIACLALGPVGGCMGCVGSCSKGAGEAASSCVSSSAGGVALGVAIGLFLMLRPGAVTKDANAGFLHDAVFTGLGLSAIFGGKWLAGVLLHVFFGADVGVVAIVSALGVPAPFSEGGIIAAYGALGAGFGGLFGLRRALVSVNRAALGWLLVFASTALLATVGVARATPERLTGVVDPIATQAQCRAALQHAFDIVTREDAVEFPESYAGSPAGLADVEAASKRCDRARQSNVACVANATNVAAIAQCGPFWLGGTHE